MADLIDRQAVVDMLQRLAYDDWNQGANTTWANAYSECAEMIRDLPAADVQQVRHGHWRHYEGMLYCSVCSEEFYDDIMEYCGDAVPKCCPNCGTRMDGE